MSARHALIVYNEADIRDLLEITLQRMGLETVTARHLGEAYARLEAESFDLCLTDMRLPDGVGLDLVAYIAKTYPGTPVAVVTAYGSAENAVASLKAGAFDYIAKPVSVAQLRDVVRAALKLPQATVAVKAALETPSAESAQPALLGESKLLRQALEMIEKLARSQAPVHVTGESGTGKEVAARTIHRKSARADGPFVAVNCGAIPETLMESEFFGYKKGAFTGANQDRDGFFQAAKGGTLFLDEVADLPLAMQVKLLRAIQEKKVRKVGDTAEENVDARIISATHQNLSERVQSGRFRQDLYYRLNVIELTMPALREMSEDIPVLAEGILQRLAAQHGVALLHLSPTASTALQDYDFPGNVRELENILERALALSSGGAIEPGDLHLLVASEAGSALASELRSLPLQEYLDRLEKTAILAALEKTRFNKTAAAKILGITFRALRYRMDRLGIE